MLTLLSRYNSSGSENVLRESGYGEVFKNLLYNIIKNYSNSQNKKTIPYLT